MGLISCDSTHSERELPKDLSQREWDQIHKKFDQIKVGMTIEEMIGFLGEPDSREAIESNSTAVYHNYHIAEDRWVYIQCNGGKVIEKPDYMSFKPCMH